MVSRLVKGTALICSLASATQAIGETSVGADISADARYSSNPFSTNGGDASAIGATLVVEPFLQWRDGTSTTRLSGNVRHTEYSRSYDSTTDYGVNLTEDARLSARTSLRGGLGFSSSILNSNQLVLSPVLGGGGIIDPNLPPVLDPILANGFRNRRIVYQGDVSVSHALSARDSINGGVSGAATRFSRNTVALREYNYVRGQIGYQRNLSARVSIGAALSVGVSDYLSAQTGDGTTYSPQLTATWQPSSLWVVNAAAGLTFSDQQNTIGKQQTTSFSGSLSACQTQSRGSLCFTAARSVVPSSLDGLSRQTSLGASFNRRLSERTTGSVYLSYARSSETSGLGARTLDNLSGGASLSRQLSRRMTAFVSAGYTDSFNSLVSRPANYSVSGGVRVRIGTLQ